MVHCGNDGADTASLQRPKTSAAGLSCLRCSPKEGTENEQPADGASTMQDLVSRATVAEEWRGVLGMRCFTLTAQSSLLELQAQRGPSFSMLGSDSNSAPSASPLGLLNDVSASRIDCNADQDTYRCDARGRPKSAAFSKEWCAPVILCPPYQSNDVFSRVESVCAVQVWTPVATTGV